MNQNCLTSRPAGLSKPWPARTHRPAGFAALVFFLFATAPAMQARADGYLKMAVMSMYQKTDANTKETRSLIDLGAGIQTNKGWVLGLIYGLENASGASGANRSSVGPTAGWSSRKDNGPYFLANYFASSTLSTGYSGMGYQLDIGYKMAISKFSLALQMSYKGFSYDKLNGAAASPTLSQSYFDPAFVLWLDL